MLRSSHANASPPFATALAVEQALRSSGSMGRVLDRYSGSSGAWWLHDPVSNVWFAGDSDGQRYAFMRGGSWCVLRSLS
jgi:hypothetical protein